MKKGGSIFFLGIALFLVWSCDTKCEKVITKNITVLVDATDTLLVQKAKYELRQENFKQLLNKKLGLADKGSCFAVNYDFGIITTYSYYNPVSTALSNTDWGKAKNNIVLGWRKFYAAHEENLLSLDTIGVMESTSLFPTLMKAINKSEGPVIVVSDLIENNPAVNFYKNAPTTPEEMESAYQKMVGYYLPDKLHPSRKTEVFFIVLSEPKNSGLVPKARAFWRYALEEHLGLSVTFADGISTL